MSLVCRNVTKRFGEVSVLKGIDWSISPGQCTGLLGNSGSGKTTLLRILAGLEVPTSGEVEWAPDDGGHAARGRSIGMVFQDLALWPHLTARQHLECVLGHLPRVVREETLERTLLQTRLPRVAWNRRPDALSGGESQRLALARALAPGPRLLLLDEPLSHVDAELRSELLTLLREATTAGDMTSIYVTHHWAEAFVLCTSIVAIDEGRLAQVGGPLDLYWRPTSERVARLTGPTVALPGSWFERNWLRTTLADGLKASLMEGLQPLLFRPQQLHLSQTGVAGWRVVRSIPCENGWSISLEREGQPLTVHAAQPQPPGSFVEIELHAPN